MVFRGRQNRLLALKSPGEGMLSWRFHFGYPGPGETDAYARLDRAAHRRLAPVRVAFRFSRFAFS
jgi:hypothetical protein